jgi:hypothetical protein
MTISSANATLNVNSEFHWLGLDSRQEFIFDLISIHYNHIFCSIRSTNSTDIAQLTLGANCTGEIAGSGYFQVMNILCM